MIAIVNHFDLYGADLSVRVDGTFSRCRVSPAEATRQAFTKPSHAFAAQAHIDAVNALDASDPRRLALGRYELIDMGEVQADRAYSLQAQAALAAALAPRKTSIIVGVQEYGRG